MSHEHIVRVRVFYLGIGAFRPEDLPEPEPDADEHFRRYLASEAPSASYDGSLLRRRCWKKVSELEGYDELVVAWNDWATPLPLDMRH